jgi:hypothetical protein
MITLRLPRSETLLFSSTLMPGAAFKYFQRVVSDSQDTVIHMYDGFPRLMFDQRAGGSDGYASQCVCICLNDYR